jgi:hypothetical protein
VDRNELLLGNYGKVRGIMSATQYQVDSHRRWMRDWADGLAYCLKCDGEYTNAQKLIIDDTEHCPHCKSDYGKKYYYCDTHGSPDDDCER